MRAKSWAAPAPLKHAHHPSASPHSPPTPARATACRPSTYGWGSCATAASPDLAPDLAPGRSSRHAPPMHQPRLCYPTARPNHRIDTRQVSCSTLPIHAPTSPGSSGREIYAVAHTMRGPRHGKMRDCRDSALSSGSAADGARFSGAESGRESSHAISCRALLNYNCYKTHTNTTHTLIINARGGRGYRLQYSKAPRVEP